jgi:predicted RNase H-like HicB family nuclease
LRKKEIDERTFGFAFYKREEIMTCPVIITEEENWIVAKDINSEVASQGKTISEALDNLKEALELYYDGNQSEMNRPVYLTTLEVTV